MYRKFAFNVRYLIHTSKLVRDVEVQPRSQGFSSSCPSGAKREERHWELGWLELRRLNSTVWVFSSRETALLLVSTQNRDLWPNPIFEHAQRIRLVLCANQICQTWLQACTGWREVHESRTSGVGPCCWPKGARPLGREFYLRKLVFLLFLLCHVWFEMNQLHVTHAFILLQVFI